MNKLTKVALAALLAVSLASVSASAANVSTGANDLILGFQVTDNTGTGATSNLEVDLGAVSLFNATASFTLNGLTAADLSATYGSGWATRSDLAFGIAGTSSTLDTFSATFSGVNPQNNTTLSGPYGNIGGLAGGLGGVAQTANSSSAGVVANSQANSFTGEITHQGALDGDYGYGGFANGSTEVNGDGSGTPTGSISLYSFNDQSGKGNKPATLLGTFSLDGNGVLTYNGVNAQAVPEPSAYALGICAVLLFLVLKRRHSVA